MAIIVVFVDVAYDVISRRQCMSMASRLISRKDRALAACDAALSFFVSHNCFVGGIIKVPGVGH